MLNIYYLYKPKDAMHTLLKHKLISKHVKLNLGDKYEWFRRKFKKKNL